MEYGLLVKNNSGDTIIDGVHKNFALYESGSATVNGITTITFATPTPEIPIIAIKPDTVFISFITYTKSGSNWTGFKLFSLSSTVIYWKVYTAHPTSLVSGYGLAAYDSTGAIIFDSGREYFKIYDIITGLALTNPPFTGATDTKTITHNNIENPYYLWSPERCSAVSEYIPPWAFKIFYTALKKASSTTATLGWQIVQQGVGVINYTNSLTQKVIVLA